MTQLASWMISFNQQVKCQLWKPETSEKNWKEKGKIWKILTKSHNLPMTLYIVGRHLYEWSTISWLIYLVSKLLCLANLQDNSCFYHCLWTLAVVHGRYHEAAAGICSQPFRRPSRGPFRRPLQKYSNFIKIEIY